MTWGEYLAYSAGQKRARTEKWEQVRKVAYSIARTMGGVEQSETEFMPLPFDAGDNEVEYIPDELLDQII